MPKTNSNFQQISIPSFEIQYFITTDHNIGQNELNGNHCSYIKFELRKKLFKSDFQKVDNNSPKNCCEL